MDKTVKIGVGVLVYDKAGKFLLMKRTGSHGEGTWAPPGGHIDFGEVAADTAKREVKEETGIEINNIEVMGFTEDLFEAEDKHYVTIFLRADRAGGELKKTDREWTEIGFFDMTDVSSMDLFASFKNFVEGNLLPKPRKF